MIVAITVATLRQRGYRSGTCGAIAPLDPTSALPITHLERIGARFNGSDVELPTGDVAL